MRHFHLEPASDWTEKDFFDSESPITGQTCFAKIFFCQTFTRWPVLHQFLWALHLMEAGKYKFFTSRRFTRACLRRWICPCLWFRKCRIFEAFCVFRKNHFFDRNRFSRIGQNETFLNSPKSNLNNSIKWFFLNKIGMDQIRPSFVYFRPCLNTITNIVQLTINEKMRGWCAWDSNPGPPESTELWPFKGKWLCQSIASSSTSDFLSEVPRLSLAFGL